MKQRWDYCGGCGGVPQDSYAGACDRCMEIYPIATLLLTQPARYSLKSGEAQQDNK
tara:strand:+ start:111 stop:278 length:168 start_codon:yes stop_codon:yes gene_type:complete